MAQASLLVLTSDFEGLSYVLLESISLNVPTISVDCPSGPKEVFGYKYAHCLTDLSDESIALKIMSALFEPKKYTPELNAIFGMKEAASAYLRLCDKSNHSKAGSSTAVDQSKDKISSMIKR